MRTTTPRRRSWSAHPAGAPARTGCREPRPSRPARCARRPTPSRSTRLPGAQPHCGSGGRRATAARRCRPRPATRGARAPPAGARANPAVDAPKRCSRRVSGIPGRRRSTTAGGASRSAAARPPAAHSGRARRNQPRRPRCVDPPQNHAARGEAIVDGASRPERPSASPDRARSARERG